MEEIGNILINLGVDFYKEILNLNMRDAVLLVIGAIGSVALLFVLKKTGVVIGEFLYKYGLCSVRNLFVATEFNPRDMVVVPLNIDIKVTNKDLYENNEVSPPIFGLTPDTGTRHIVSPYNKEKQKAHKKFNKKKYKNELFFLTSVTDFNFRMVTPHIKSDSGFSYGSETGCKAIDIVKKVIDPCLATDHPDIISIFGRIGCGKSTLIQSILVEYEKRNSERAGQMQYFPVVINVREKFKDLFNEILVDGIVSTIEIQRLLEERLLHSIISICKINFDSDQYSKFSDADSLPMLMYVLQDKLECSPIVVLDELDTIYSIFCKYTFCLLNDIPMHKYRSQYKSILEYFFTLPVDEMSKGRLNNCVFIVVSRSSSEKLYEELISRNDNLSNNGIFSSVGHTIHIVDYDSEFANKVIKKRLETKLSYVHKRSREINNSKHVITVLSNTLSVLEQENIDYDENLIISIHGLRHIMMLLGKAEMLDSSSVLLTKYINVPGLLKTFQYLDGRPDFFSTREGVSNIFLVNTKYALENCGADNDNTRRSIIKNHLYTFSLKYLVIGYIVSAYDEGKPLYLEDIYNKFTDKSGKDLVYEYKLLQLALYHATEVKHGRLLKLAYDKTVDRFYLIPSRRARAMFNDGLFWEFGYLMVIVEDKWLEVIPSLRSVFDLHKSYDNSTRDDIMTTFDFFVSIHEREYKEKIDFIKSKIDSVLTFCYILEIAFYYEGKRYQECFHAYKASKSTNDNDLDISEKIKFVRISILKFTKLFVGEKALVEIEDYLKNNENKIKYITKLKMHLFYISYHKIFSFVTLGNKMKKYHKLIKF